MNDDENCSGLWNDPDALPDNINSLSDKVDMVIEDRHSFEKSDQLIHNLKQGYIRYHWLSWCPKLEKLLSDAYRDGVTIPELANDFRRTEKSIRMKLESMGFEIATPGEHTPGAHTLLQQSVAGHPSPGNATKTVRKPVILFFGDQVERMYGR